MFCLTLEPNHYEFIKSLGYIPVGLGEKDFDSNWFTDKSGTNIAKKSRKKWLQPPLLPPLPLTAGPSLPWFTSPNCLLAITLSTAGCSHAAFELSRSVGGFGLQIFSLSLTCCSRGLVKVFSTLNLKAPPPPPSPGGGGADAWRRGCWPPSS